MKVGCLVSDCIYLDKRCANDKRFAHPTLALLQYIAAIYLVLVVFISPGIPLLIKFFFGILPYLHSWLLINRLIFFLSLWLLGVGIYLLLANQKQKKSVLFTLHFGFRDWVLALLGALLAIYTSASLFATSIGSLVKLFPTEPYSAQMTVIKCSNPRF